MHGWSYLPAQVSIPPNLAHFIPRVGNRKERNCQPQRDRSSGPGRWDGNVSQRRFALTAGSSVPVSEAKYPPLTLNHDSREGALDAAAVDNKPILARSQCGVTIYTCVTLGRFSSYHWSSVSCTIAPKIQVEASLLLAPPTFPRGSVGSGIGSLLEAPLPSPRRPLYPCSVIQATYFSSWQGFLRCLPRCRDPSINLKAQPEVSYVVYATFPLFACVHPRPVSHT
ncbi:hypothetical protein B0H63DRAFT_482448 [Podospora didyma]|uniref:Uncharacterized protein n=1 Tax=Podospora didyma TaxID=330526 RepID=A0AAE0KFJ4_9PEZI|nr:hypothetical protein B0H63DRAFT_482448 [Podospora didyma]